MNSRRDLIGVKRDLRRLEELGLIGGRQAACRWIEELSRGLGRPIKEWRETDVSAGRSGYSAFKPIPCPFGTGEIDFGGPSGFYLVAGEGGRLYLYLDELNLTLAGGPNCGTGIAGWGWREIGMERWRRFSRGLTALVASQARPGGRGPSTPVGPGQIE